MSSLLEYLRGPLMENIRQFNEFLVVAGAAIGIVGGAWARAWNKQRYTGKHREGNVPDLELVLEYVGEIRPGHVIPIWTNIGRMDLILRDGVQEHMLANSDLNISFSDLKGTPS